jgi:hypothetical protein
VRFRTTVELGGKTATGLVVPADVVDALGAGKKPPVRVTIGGHTYRSTVAVRGGRYLLPLSAENRAGAGVAAGDEVDVEARKTFEGLPYSHRQRHVLAVEEARTPETRQRRITKALEMLREGRR